MNRVSKKVAPASKKTSSSPLEGFPIPKKRNSPGSITISTRGIQTGLILAILGIILFILGARPSWVGLDRSPVIGFVQIAVFELGLGLICIGGYVALKRLSRDQKASIPFEFGVRFIATGYAISIFCGLADLIGIGSHHLPLLYFGPLQSVGMLLGQGLSALGLMMLIPFTRGPRSGKSPQILTPKPN